MKTLVIHPADYTTDFLSVIYEGKDWTVMNESTSKSALKQAIMEHDRIIMLGHGTERGLFGYGRFVIDSTLVYLLREKYCVCIWCNADGFVTKYGIKGFYTGMIISEDEEANLYCVTCSLYDLDVSNELFAKSVADSIDSTDMLSEMKSKYIAEDNPVIEFNKQNLYLYND